MTQYNRVFNFSAGPSMLPVEVLENVQRELLNYQGSGQSVMEMSHRSQEFKKIIDDAEADLRELMHIPDNYKVLFLQGGGTLQFAMVPLNLLTGSKKADYVLTGTWAKKAYKEATKFGDIRVIASSEDDKFTWVPKITKEDIRPDADYVYITSNNTIYGTKYNYVPETGDIPLVADMSSNILSEEVDVTKFGIIWAGAQKNVAPAGVAIVIIREDLIGKAPAEVPTYLDYKIHADNGSMYNTPPCFSIYVAGEVFKYLKRIGGVKSLQLPGCQGRPFPDERGLRDRRRGSRQEVCRRGQRQGSGQSGGTPLHRRYAGQHLQRDAERGRGSADSIYERV